MDSSDSSRVRYGWRLSVDAVSDRTMQGSAYPTPMQCTAF